MNEADELARLQAERLDAHRILPSRPIRDARGAAAFIRARGIVMETGRSSLPILTEAIAGRVIRGSWMADREVHRIHDVAYAIDETHEFLKAPLILGKRAVFVPELGPAVARIATDPERREAVVRRLSPLARRLLADVEGRREVQIDEWNAGSREARAARLDLARQLLVASVTIHTDGGRHSVVVRPWIESEIARRFARHARRLSYTDAQDTLILAALRSAVVAPERELRRWAELYEDTADRLIDAARVRRVRVDRVTWLTCA